MSRDLDVRVAEAMGWRWDDDWECLIPPEQKAKPAEMWTDWLDNGDGDEYREPVKANTVSGIVYNGNFTKIHLPEFSTDISAAWQVVEWMKAHGYTYCLSGEEDGSAGMWFGKPEWFTDDLYQSRTLPWGRAGTAPEAICLAFLTALEATCAQS